MSNNQMIVHDPLGQPYKVCRSCGMDKGLHTLNCEFQRKDILEQIKANKNEIPNPTPTNASNPPHHGTREGDDMDSNL